MLIIHDYTLVLMSNGEDGVLAACQAAAQRPVNFIDVPGEALRSMPRKMPMRGLAITISILMYRSPSSEVIYASVLMKARKPINELRREKYRCRDGITILSRY